MTENIEKIVESLLLSSSRPLTEAEILKAFNDSDDVNSADIKEALNKLENFYSERSIELVKVCLLYTSPSPRDNSGSRMPSSA